MQDLPTPRPAATRPEQSEESEESEPSAPTRERARIIAAARRIVEAGGGDALSMRKLAAEVGVAHTAVYWHVGGRDEVIKAVVDSFLEDVPDIRPIGSTPRQRITSLVLQVHRRGVEYPKLVDLAIDHGYAAQLWDPATLMLTTEFTNAGLTGDAIGDAVTAILYLSGAFVTLEAALKEHTDTRASVPIARGVFTDSLATVLDSLLRS